MGEFPELEAALVAYLPTRRWFRSKDRKLSSARLLDRVELGTVPPAALVFVEVSFAEGASERDLLAVGEEAGETAPERAIAGVPSRADGPARWVVDVSEQPHVAEALHELAVAGGTLRGASSALRGVRSNGAEPWIARSLSAKPLAGEQSNSAFLLGREVVGKLARKLEDGPSLAAEVLEHLARAPAAPGVPRLLARVEADLGRGVSTTLWLSETYLENEGDAWRLTLDAVTRCFEQVLATERGHAPELPPMRLAPDVDVPTSVAGLLGEHLPLVRLLARRTADLHRALAHDPAHPRFRPVAPDAPFRQSFHASLRDLATRTFELLSGAALEPPARELASALREREGELHACFGQVLSRPATGNVLRVHGDYHLGQVLFTGTDFCIVDFDGEPGRLREERERRRSPLSDVASMMRSFHYAAHGALMGELTGSRVRAEDRDALAPWAAFHERWSSAVFLAAYRLAMAGSDLLPETLPELERELRLHLLEKALYEIGYELRARPHWVELPLRGALDALDG